MSKEVLRDLVRNPSALPAARLDAARALYLHDGRAGFDDSPEMKSALAVVIESIVQDWKAPVTSQLFEGLSEVRTKVNANHETLSRSLEGVHNAAQSRDAELRDLVAKQHAAHCSEFEQVRSAIGTQAEKTSNVRISVLEQMELDREHTRDLAARLASIESWWGVRLVFWLRGLFS